MRINSAPQTLYKNIKYTFCTNCVVGPSSADSANSHQGCFSRVQKTNGYAEPKTI